MVLDYTLNGPPAATHYDVLILMYDLSMVGPPTPDTPEFRVYYTPQQLGDAIFNDPDGVSALVNEASLGKVSLSGRVVGWFDLGAQTTSASTLMANREMYAEMATPHADFSKYDVIYFVFMTDANDFLQLGWLLQNTIKVSQGTFPVGIDYMINSDFYTRAGIDDYYYSVILPSRPWAHELIHTLGSGGHDVSLACGTAVLASSCAVNAYGNSFSLMGESALGNHPSLGSKKALGFVGADQVSTVTATADFALCPTETVDPGKKGLIIPLKTPISILSTTAGSTAVYDRVFVEYRRALGFDRYLDRLGTDWLDVFKADGLSPPV